MTGPLIARIRPVDGSEAPSGTYASITVVIVEIDINTGAVLYAKENGDLCLGRFADYVWNGDIKISRLAPPPPAGSILHKVQ